MSGLPDFQDLPFLPGQKSAEGKEEGIGPDDMSDRGPLPLQMETLPAELQEICQVEALKGVLSPAGNALAEEEDSAASDSSDASATFAAAAAASTSYSSAVSDSSDASADTVVVHLASAPGDPVPWKAMDTDTASLLKQVCEGLVVLNESGEPVPGSAEKWEVSGDGRTWTFTLREDLRWADGEPMEAEDFAALFRRIADPATEALYGKDLCGNIAGYEDVLGGDPEALGVEAQDSRKLLVRLQNPDPEFALKCASWAFLPIRQGIRGEDLSEETARWEEIIGNGPYSIASVEPGQNYVLKKNPWYHSGFGDADEAQAFEEVLWKTQGDCNEEYSAFLNGEMDALSQIPEEELADAADMCRVQTVPDMIGILFNCHNDALEDPRVRTALAAAVDREYISTEILDHYYAPTALPGLPVQDPSLAEDLLAEAGFRNGRGIPALTCVTDEAGGAYLIAEYLASVWGELGLDVIVRTADADELAQCKAEGDYDLLCGNILLPSDVQDRELVKFVSEDAGNVTGFSSAAFDEVMEKTEADTSADKYEKHLEEAVEILAEELPVLPLAERSVTWVCRDDAEGIFCDPSGCWQLWKSSGAEEGKKDGVDDRTDDTWSRQDEETEEAAAADAYFEEQEKGAVGKSGAGSASADWNGTGSASADKSGAGSDPADNSGTGKKTPWDADRESDSSLTGDLMGDRMVSGESAGTAGSGSGAPEEAHAEEDPGADTALSRLRSSAAYFMRTSVTGCLTRQAWVLDAADPSADRLVSLPKYTEVHLVGVGNEEYARIEEGGRFYYLDADRVTSDPAVQDKVRAEEAEENLQRELLTVSMHTTKETELAARAADLREETERILAEIAHHEMIRTQTRNPNWNGPVLSRRNGSIMGPSGKETYYNLNMNGVVNIMRRMGNTDEYWVRDDGCKMLGDYIMCAANLRVHPRGSLVECSLGTCIVCDTGGFASSNARQLDIAVTW